MVLTDFLNDAAICLHAILAKQKINFGIFGGYAVSSLGGPRESKDIDCLVAIDKANILKILDGQGIPGRGNFAAINQTRQDYVAFFWTSEKDAKKNHSVLVEIFCEKFPGMLNSRNQV